MAEFGHVAQRQTALGGCAAWLFRRFGPVFPDGMFAKLFTPACALSSRLDAQQFGRLDGGGVVGLVGAARLALPLGPISQAMACASRQRQFGLDGFMAAGFVVSNTCVSGFGQYGRKIADHAGGVVATGDVANTALANSFFVWPFANLVGDAVYRRQYECAGFVRHGGGARALAALVLGQFGGGVSAFKQHFIGLCHVRSRAHLFLANAFDCGGFRAGLAQRLVAGEIAR